MLHSRDRRARPAAASAPPHRPRAAARTPSPPPRPLRRAPSSSGAAHVARATTTSAPSATPRAAASAGCMSRNSPTMQPVRLWSDRSAAADRSVYRSRPAEERQLAVAVRGRLAQGWPAGGQPSQRLGRRRHSGGCRVAVSSRDGRRLARSACPTAAMRSHRRLRDSAGSAGRFASQRRRPAPAPRSRSCASAGCAPRCGRYAPRRRRIWRSALVTVPFLAKIGDVGEDVGRLLRPSSVAISSITNRTSSASSAARTAESVGQGQQRDCPWRRSAPSAFPRFARGVQHPVHVEPVFAGTHAGVAQADAVLFSGLQDVQC